MKKIPVLMIALLMSFSLIAQPPSVPAEKGDVFGAKVTEEGAIKAKDLTAFLAGKEKADVKVKGKVTEVCKAEGCWLRMETKEGSNMLIKMKDHKFLVPLVLSGKTVIAEGTATLKETSVDMLRHYAEDAGKSKEEIAKITEPKKEIVLQATGILVL